MLQLEKKILRRVYLVDFCAANDCVLIFLRKMGFSHEKLGFFQVKCGPVSRALKWLFKIVPFSKEIGWQQMIAVWIFLEMKFFFEILSQFLYLYVRRIRIILCRTDFRLLFSQIELRFFLWSY